LIHEASEGNFFTNSTKFILFFLQIYRIWYISGYTYLFNILQVSLVQSIRLFIYLSIIYAPVVFTLLLEDKIFFTKLSKSLVISAMRLFEIEDLSTEFLSSVNVLYFFDFGICKYKKNLA